MSQKQNYIIFHQFAGDMTVDGYHSSVHSGKFFFNGKPDFPSLFCETKTKEMTHNVNDS